MLTLQTILYKNSAISFSDEGKGTAIVLLHGFLENQKMWRYLQPELLKKQYRVITIDLLGHGNTDNIGYIHTMEDMADAVYEVIHYLRLRKIIIAGHSMGGYVALSFAQLHTEMIKGLILINSTAIADSDERKLNRNRAIKAIKANKQIAVGMAIANLFSPENRVALTKDIEIAKKEAQKTSLQGIIAAQEGMKIRPNMEHIWHTTSYPKILFLGKKDPILSFYKTKEQITDTNVTFVPLSGGHMSHLENKDEMAQEILRFLHHL